MSPPPSLTHLPGSVCNDSIFLLPPSLPPRLLPQFSSVSTQPPSAPLHRTSVSSQHRRLSVSLNDRREEQPFTSEQVGGHLQQLFNELITAGQDVCNWMSHFKREQLTFLVLFRGYCVNLVNQVSKHTEGNNIWSQTKWLWIKNLKVKRPK